MTKIMLWSDGPHRAAEAAGARFERRGCRVAAGFMQQGGIVVEDPLEVVLVVPVRCLQDGERPLVEWLGGRGVALRGEEQGEVAQALRRQDVSGPKRRLPDRQGALEQRPCPLVVLLSHLQGGSRISRARRYSPSASPKRPCWRRRMARL
jgi:hypothetical protein